MEAQLVDEISEGGMTAQIYRIGLDEYVVADQAGWLDGLFASAGEARQAVLAANGRG